MPLYMDGTRESVLLDAAPDPKCEPLPVSSTDDATRHLPSDADVFRVANFL